MLLSLRLRRGVDHPKTSWDISCRPRTYGVPFKDPEIQLLAPPSGCLNLASSSTRGPALELFRIFRGGYRWIWEKSFSKANQEQLPRSLGPGPRSSEERGKRDSGHKKEPELETREATVQEPMVVAEGGRSCLVKPQARMCHLLLSSV